MLQDIYSLLDDFMQPKCYRVRNLGNVLKYKVLHCMALKLKNLPCKPDYWPTFALYLIAAANNSATLSTDIDFLIIFSQSFLSLSSQYESAKSKSPTKKKKTGMKISACIYHVRMNLNFDVVWTPTNSFLETGETSHIYSDSNGIQTHKPLVHKRALNDFLNVNFNMFVQLITSQRHLSWQCDFG